MAEASQVSSREQRQYPAESLDKISPVHTQQIGAPRAWPIVGECIGDLATTNLARRNGC
jgi:hypothetical protein